MNPEHKKEILFYYESDHANPNGDPGFENMPRLVQDGTILVTDVRIKRTIRDYAKNVLKETLFVERKKEGESIKADERVKEILGLKLDEGINIDIDIIKKLLEKTFDVPLFGALVPIRKLKVIKKGESAKKANQTELVTNDPDSQLQLEESQVIGRSAKLTGTVQFGLGKSVNQPEILTPSITSAFQGAETSSQTTYGSIGKFSIVDYALIKVHGAINPMNLGDYYKEDEIKKIFKEKESILFECLWNGTNELITRSKWRQKSIFFIEVTYQSSIYNDLASLIVENDIVKRKRLKKLPTLNTTSNDNTEKIFNFQNFIKVMELRKNNIIQIRMKGSEEIKQEIDILYRDLQGKLGNDLIKKIN
jgi:CRISPR-associated protein Csh2